MTIADNKKHILKIISFIILLTCISAIVSMMFFIAFGIYCSFAIIIIMMITAQYTMSNSRFGDWVLDKNYMSASEIYAFSKKEIE